LLEQNNQIHPTAIIGSGVTIGTNNLIGPFVRIYSNTVIGDSNFIGTGSVIGALPEYRSLDHKGPGVFESLAGVTIGSGVVIREYCQIHQGLKRPTRIDDGAFIMNQTYIAHDCEVGSEAVLASSVLLAGNVVVGIQANIGMGAKVHQGLSIGRLSMVGMGSVVTRDVPECMKSYGVPSRVHGVNEIGMERAGMSQADITAANILALKSSS
jgi:UDP-N-acetylglucosamine acyltransferase